LSPKNAWGRRIERQEKTPGVFIRGIKKALENIVFSRACGGRKT
jgi:hypothetical protein